MHSSSLQRWEEVLGTHIESLDPLMLPEDAKAASSAVPHDEAAAEFRREVYKSGWLDKRGKLNRAWKRRWFVLKNSQLEYYKTPEHSQPQGVILLADGSSRITEETRFGKNMMIELASVEGRKFFLSGYSADDLRAWVAALRPCHASARLTEMHKLSTATQPAASHSHQPPIPTSNVWQVQKGYLHRIIKESLVKMTPSHKICKIGCGATACRHCDPYVQVGPDLHTAITGLHASWVTHSVIASSRPSDRLLEVCVWWVCYATSHNQ